ncbi:MAG TPA: LacI family DNA-binding transcriptional regulator [Rhodanobacteraceae bacterium]|nr:LacI family DNA-binding transcriptional regulator [Rhodanobacteraceae bacterium]
MSTKGKITSLDIAHRAGVSQSTVSRALRGSTLVSEETRQRVRQAARELHYKVDKNASNLRTQHSGTLALLLFEDPTADESHINPFFLAMLGSITRACAQRGYDLLVSFQQLSDDWHSDYADTRKADGIILLGYGDYVAWRDKLDTLIEQGTHFVRWGAVLDGQPGVSIGCDNFQGGFDVTRHLLAQGCRRIAFLGEATEHYPEFLDRYHGHCAALRDADLQADRSLLEAAESTRQSGYDAMQALLSRKASFDAVFAASDLIAVGAMHALADHGLAVPKDVAVAGFDDIPLASFVHPPLTTAHQDTSSAGAMLVDRLLAQVAGETTENIKLPAKLMIRASSLRNPNR